MEDTKTLTQEELEAQDAQLAAATSGLAEILADLGLED